MLQRNKEIFKMTVRTKAAKAIGAIAGNNSASLIILYFVEKN
jgi:hypothetical protein